MAPDQPDRIFKAIKTQTTFRYVIGLFLALAMMGCSQAPKSDAYVGLEIHMSQATGEDAIDRIVVQAAGPAGTQYYTLTKDATAPVWRGNLNALEVGAWIFSGRAFTANGVVRFVGSVNLSIHGGDNGVVLLTLSDVNPPAPLSNHAPVIRAIVLSHSYALPVDEQMTAEVFVDDADGDAVTVSWDLNSIPVRASFPNGVSTQGLNVLITSTGVLGAFSLRVDGADIHDSHTSISLDFNVTEGGTGTGTIEVHIDEAPVIESFFTFNGNLQTNKVAELYFIVRDPEHKPMQYSAMSSCLGVFVIPNAAIETGTVNDGGRLLRFIPGGDAASECSFALTVSDAHSTSTATLIAPLNVMIETLQPPIFETFRLSRPASYFNDDVIASVSMIGDGPFKYTWTTNNGTIEFSRSSGCTTPQSCTDVAWVPGPCLPDASTITVRAESPDGSFAIKSLKLNTCAPISCRDALNQSPFETPANGYTTIDPDGPGAGVPFTTYCDQETMGGGWMLFGAVGPNAKVTDQVFSDANMHFPSIRPDAAINDNWEFRGLNSFRGYGNRWTIRVDIDVTNDGTTRQHSFFRPVGDASPQLIGLDVVTQNRNDSFEILTRSSNPAAPVSNNWFSMAGLTAEFPATTPPGIALFGYRRELPSGPFPSCFAADGSTQLCNGPGGLVGSNMFGTTTHSGDYNYAGIPVPVSEHHAARFYIKDTRLDVVPAN
jgi:hypothetical protein